MGVVVFLLENLGNLEISVYLVILLISRYESNHLVLDF